MIEHLNSAWAELTSPGAQFAMTETNVDGVPMRVYAAAPPNMRLVWDMARGFGERDYIVFEDERLTYAQADERIRALAHHLATVDGVAKGDRVAIAMRNYPEWVLAYWAIASIGAVVVGMNAWWTPKEMAYGLSDSSPKVLIADTERLERASEILDSLDQPIALIGVRVDRTKASIPQDTVDWEAVMAIEGVPDVLPPVEIDPNDDVTIFYTSGTTGNSKGAQLTHRGSVHNLMNMAFMPLVQTTAMMRAAGVTSEQSEASQLVAMAPTPLFHVTAMNCVLHPITAVGGKIVLTYRWDTARAIELIEREQVNVFSGVPTMSREMLAHPDWATRDTSALKGMGGGGAPLQPDLVDKIDKSLAGGAPNVGYGLTETHGIVTSSTAALYTSRPESVGRAVPVADVKLVDADGNDVEPGSGQPGELCVRGPIVVKGYLNKPEATADAIRDGWFRTGDIATIDADGYIYIVDRIKDMVLRGGENVYCSEVESAVYEHPDVAEAAVFALPDERLGESVAAAVVLHDGRTLTHDQLSEFLSTRIAKHKIPEHVFFRTDPLPRNANGKFVKRELRDQLSDGG